jgi:hypothetical protein
MPVVGVLTPQSADDYRNVFAPFFQGLKDATLGERYSSLGPDLHRLDRTSLRLAHLFDHLIGGSQQSQLIVVNARHTETHCRAAR